MPLGYGMPKGVEAMWLAAGAQLGNNAPPVPSTLRGHVLPFNIYGRNNNISAAVDLWGMNVVKTFPTTSFTLAVISDSTNDTGAGTGTQTLLVHFLDANWLPHTALYTLNGQTAVTVPTQVDGVANATPQTAIRVNWMESVAVGSGGSNAGNITANDSTNTYTTGVPVTAAKTFDYMYVGDNCSSGASFSMPAGYRGVLMAAIPSFDDVTTTVKFGSIRWRQNCTLNGPFQTRLLGQLTTQSGTNLIEWENYPIIEPQTDVVFGGNTSAAGVMSIYAQGMMWRM